MSLLDPVCRNVTLQEGRSSLRLERRMWDVLDRAAEERGVRTFQMIRQIEREHYPEIASGVSLSSVLRVFAVEAAMALQAAPAQVMRRATMGGTVVRPFPGGAIAAGGATAA